MTNLAISKSYEIALPRKQLFDAWISPKTVIAPVSRIEVLPQAGGFLKLFVETPEGVSQMHGVFQTFERPERLQYSWEWDENGEVTQIDVRFVEISGGTRIEIEHTGFRSAASRETHDSGWDSYVAGVVELLKD
ncbi:MAG: SRPBCC domain-containing protein [Chloroflexota bacterium]